MIAPTPETLAEVERMLPCGRTLRFGELSHTCDGGLHDGDCAATYLPTVAQALQVYKDRVGELSAEVERLQTVIDSRPAINAGLPDTYIAWSRSIYAMEITNASGETKQ